MISGSSDPFNNLYFRICKEIMISYTDPRMEVSESVKEIFGEVLDIKEGDRPFPVTYISKIMGMGPAYLTDLFQRRSRSSAQRPFINLKTFAMKMEPSLKRAFGEDVGKDIIDEYLRGQGVRFQLIYSFYKILVEKTGKYYNTEVFSQILFQDPGKSKVLKRTPDPAIRDLNEMWKLEDLINKLRPNRELGFDNDGRTITDIDKVIKEIQFESKKLIRSAVMKQLHGSLSPVAVLMIWESLNALSKKGREMSFAALSQEIDLHGSKLYLTSKVFGAGRNPADSVAESLLKLLEREGVSSDDMSVQWTQLFLDTRGLNMIDFDFYLNELTLAAANTRVSDKSVLNPEQKLLARTIVYALTGGRSWKTGKEISYDEALVHHIRHGSNGKTLYGGVYDTLKNFACLKGDKENRDVEGAKRQQWEATFIYMWKQFKAGNWKEAVKHWPNRADRTDFLRERRSKRYLDYWLGKL